MNYTFKPVWDCKWVLFQVLDFEYKLEGENGFVKKVRSCRRPASLLLVVRAEPPENSSQHEDDTNHFEECDDRP